MEAHRGIEKRSILRMQSDQLRSDRERWRMSPLRKTYSLLASTTGWPISFCTSASG